MKLFALTVAIALVAFGCQRAQENKSSVTIQIPSASQFQGLSQATGKVGSLATVDYEKLCFLVNVKGDGLPKTTATCEFERGTLTGTVAPGTVLTLEVLSGDARTFEIYGFLRESNTDTCPTVSEKGLGWPVNKIYFLGQAANVTVSPPSTSVDVKITLPNASQNIVAQNNLPGSCLPPTVSGRSLVGTAVSTSSNFKLRSRLSDRNAGQLLQSPNFKIHGAIQGL